MLRNLCQLNLLLALTTTSTLNLSSCRSAHSSPVQNTELSAVSTEVPLHALESKAPSEDALITGLVASIKATVTNHRDAHPKAHACVYNAALTVEPQLAANFQEGIFSIPGKTYEAIARFSSGSSSPQADDRAAGGHGLALKILLDKALQEQIADIPGEVMHTPPNPPAFAKERSTRDFYKTYDIISINGLSEFLVDDLPTYPAFFKASAMVGAAAKQAAAEGKTPQQIAQITSGIWAQEYFAKIPAENVSIIATNLKTFGSLKSSNLLAERYNSWVPYAFDEKRAVKYSFVPCTDLSSSRVVEKDANFLGAQLKSDLNSKIEGCFELVAQFHDESMPSVEHAALPWGKPENRQYIKLATLRFDNKFTDPSFCEALSFNPGHALPNQRGIGSTQRARRLIYAAISDHRTSNSK